LYCYVCVFVQFEWRKDVLNKKTSKNQFMHKNNDEKTICMKDIIWNRRKERNQEQHFNPHSSHPPFKWTKSQAKQSQLNNLNNKNEERKKKKRRSDLVNRSCDTKKEKEKKKEDKNSVQCHFRHLNEHRSKEGRASHCSWEGLGAAFLGVFLLMEGGMTPPPAMVALMSMSSSSSPRMAYWR